MINQQQMTNQEAVELVSAALTVITEHTQGRKYTQFRQKCQELHAQLSEVLFLQIDDQPGHEANLENEDIGKDFEKIYKEEVEQQDGIIEEEQDGDQDEQQQQERQRIEVKVIERNESLEDQENGEIGENSETVEIEHVEVQLSDVKKDEEQDDEESIEYQSEVPISKELQETEAAIDLPDLQGFSQFGWKRLLSVFEAGLELRKPLVSTTILDLLCKLIAKGFLTGIVQDLGLQNENSVQEVDILSLSERDINTSFQADSIHSIPSFSPPANVVQLMCNAQAQNDESVELSILRGLLTAVISPNLTIHGQALIISIRTCFNLFVSTKNEVTQVTAKGVMAQILKLVVVRLESRMYWVVPKPINLTEIFDSSSLSDLNLNQYSTQAALSKRQAILYAQNMLEEASEQVVVVQGLSKMQIVVLSSNEFDDLSRKSNASQQSHQLHRQSINMLRKVSTYSICENETFENSQNIEKTLNNNNSNKDQQQGLGQGQEQGDVNDLWNRDMYLVFRALCRISYQQDQNGLRGRILALELLKFVLEEVGETIKQQTPLTNLIKNHLNYSLLKNSTSTEIRVTQLTSQILFTLLKKLRAELKAENGVFVPMILLKSIEPQSQLENFIQEPGIQNFELKKIILQSLQEICNDGQMLIDLFVNYDCDLESTVNIFERMVQGLVGMAHGNREGEIGMMQGGQHWHTQDWLLRQKALACLVSMIASMYKFYQDTAPQSLAKQQSLNEVNYLESETDNDSESLQSSLLAQAQTQGKDYDTQLLTKKKLLRGVALFNSKPNRGMTFLQEEGLVGLEPKDVAKFLAVTDGLDKTKIGDYLGEKDDKNIQVMHAYVDDKDFAGMEIDDAIRDFLVGFRLPGEGQKIDRLMEKFAERYYSTNSSTGTATVFKNADAAYVLSYSIIMLNTDLHNPTNKNKMTEVEFIRNNRGINAGEDLPAEFLNDIYQRILNNEIKLRDEVHNLNRSSVLSRASMSGAAPANGRANLSRTSTVFDTIISLIPNRRASISTQPSDDAIKNTLDYLKQKAKGAQFFVSRDPETLRPMLELSWAGILGVFTKLFEEGDADHVELMCLEGLKSGACLSAAMGVELVRNAYVKSLANFTSLTTPQQIGFTNAMAFKVLLTVAEEVGDHLHESWTMILRCMSRFEYLHQLTTGGPSDSLLFSARVSLTAATSEPLGRIRAKSKRARLSSIDLPPRMAMPMDSDTLVLNRNSLDSSNSSNSSGIRRWGSTTHSVNGEENGLPQKGVLEVINQYEFNKLFIASDKLDSDAIVEFVQAICEVSYEELRERRVFLLAKIVEIAHFNMDRIRLVWSRVWDVLSEFFVQVGCNENLRIAMYAVDSLRQLSMKFLERDELSNYSFQNDFLRPFTVIMRHSKAIEIRELIIRCISQMIFARVQNIKSGWKSMFMVFSQAATDKNQAIVYLAFETVEKIVRDHFRYITETETIVFTDCVNCLTAFANSPHNSNIALNAIAFLRYCALKLAEGTIGDVEDPLPDGTLPHNLNVKVTRIISQDESLLSRDSGVSPIFKSEGQDPTQSLKSQESFKFTDRDEHVYYWFPLLTGLSELTFDPREEIRYGALEVLFDTLKFHGHAFSESFWARVLDSVLLPIFDHVRAEVTDTFTFTSSSRRAIQDAWLFETCTQCLYHLVDIYIQYFKSTRNLMYKLLRLLKGFVCRSHESLALMGVQAFGRLFNGTGAQMNQEEWERVINTLYEAVMDSLPNVKDMVTSPIRKIDSDRHVEVSGEENNVIESGNQQLLLISAYSLKEGIGARRLTETRCRIQVQISILQVCMDTFSSFQEKLSVTATDQVLCIFDNACLHARAVNLDLGLRREVQWLQQHNNIENGLLDPPLLQTELNSSNFYLAALQKLQSVEDNVVMKTECKVDERITNLLLRNLKRFQEDDQVQISNSDLDDSQHESRVVNLASHADEFESFSQTFVDTLVAINNLEEDCFRQNLGQFFPMLTSLLRHPHTPKAVLKSLGDLYDNRISAILGLNVA